MEFERSCVDGVPVFWTKSGDEMLAGLHRQFTWLSGYSDTAVAGRAIRSADSPLDPARLVVGADGVSLVRARATTTVRAAECAALLQWPDRGTPVHRMRWGHHPR